MAELIPSDRRESPKGTKRGIYEKGVGMFLLARLIAVLFVAAGCVLILRPAVMEKLLEYLKQGKRIYGAGALRIVIGLILMTASFDGRIPWVVMFLGLVILASGILVFVLKKDKVLELAEKIFPKSQTTLNLIGTIPLLLGILLFCAL